jgi:hypothetical protein
MPLELSCFFAHLHARPNIRLYLSSSRIIAQGPGQWPCLQNITMLTPSPEQVRRTSVACLNGCCKRLTMHQFSTTSSPGRSVARSAQSSTRPVGLFRVRPSALRLTGLVAVDVVKSRVQNAVKVSSVSLGCSTAEYLIVRRRALAGPWPGTQIQLYISSPSNRGSRRGIRRSLQGGLPRSQTSDGA